MAQDNPRIAVVFQVPPKNSINRFDVCLPVLWAQCGKIARLKDQFVKTLFLIKIGSYILQNSWACFVFAHFL